MSAEEWNKWVPEGTPVLYWPGVKRGPWAGRRDEVTGLGPLRDACSPGDRVCWWHRPLSYRT